MVGIRLSGCDFADEEKKQLSRYLGSMLRREPTEEEAEQQRVLDWAGDTGFSPEQMGITAPQRASYNYLPGPPACAQV